MGFAHIIYDVRLVQCKENGTEFISSRRIGLLKHRFNLSSCYTEATVAWAFLEAQVSTYSRGGTGTEIAHVA